MKKKNIYLLILFNITFFQVQWQYRAQEKEQVDIRLTGELDEFFFKIDEQIQEEFKKETGFFSSVKKLYKKGALLGKLLLIATKHSGIIKDFKNLKTEKFIQSDTLKQIFGYKINNKFLYELLTFVDLSGLSFNKKIKDIHYFSFEEFGFFMKFFIDNFLKSFKSEALTNIVKTSEERNFINNIIKIMEGIVTINNQFLSHDLNKKFEISDNNKNFINNIIITTLNKILFGDFKTIFEEYKDKSNKSINIFFQGLQEKIVTEKSGTQLTSLQQNEKNHDKMKSTVESIYKEILDEWKISKIIIDSYVNYCNENNNKQLNSREKEIYSHDNYVKIAYILKSLQLSTRNFIFNTHEKLWRDKKYELLRKQIFDYFFYLIEGPLEQNNFLSTCFFSFFRKFEKNIFNDNIDIDAFDIYWVQSLYEPEKSWDIISQLLIEYSRDSKYNDQKIKTAQQLFQSVENQNPQTTMDLSKDQQEKNEESTPDFIKDSQDYNLIANQNTQMTISLSKDQEENIKESTPDFIKDPQDYKVSFESLATQNPEMTMDLSKDQEESLPHIVDSRKDSNDLFNQEITMDLIEDQQQEKEEFTPGFIKDSQDYKVSFESLATQNPEMTMDLIENQKENIEESLIIDDEKNNLSQNDNLKKRRSNETGRYVLISALASLASASLVYTLYQSKKKREKKQEQKKKREKKEQKKKKMKNKQK